MAKAKAILKRRRVVTNTRKITRTMELVSTARFRQSFNRVEGARPYFRSILEVMQDLSRADLGIDHPLLRRREPVRHVTLLVLTSNRGLCGGFNTHLCRLGRDAIEELRQSGAQVALHVVGKKGIAFFRFRKFELAGAHTAFGDRPTYAPVEALAEEFLAAYESGRTDRVVVCSQRYLSAASQRPQLETLLPITPPTQADAAVRPREYLVSPDAAGLMARLLPAYFKIVLYQLFLETAVGEHRARMVAMKNATDNAESMITSLTRRYNRARQGQITNEISEIMGGVEALK
ncbi:MAG TPA: ATP synthase F1 subunit gamma [Candidatus Krumholzibacteria bacterium]|nr:ATP synthase F1 subunit gamma [Candidatus Krumholzibacteria bacterium]